MEVVFINTGHIFNLLDRKAIFNYLRSIKLDHEIPFFKSTIAHYVRFTKRDYFQKYMERRPQNSYKEREFVTMVKKKHPVITNIFDDVNDFIGVENFFFIFKKIREVDSFSGNKEEIYTTYVSVPPVRIYEHLSSFSFVRDEKLYKMDPELIECIWNYFPDHFVTKAWVASNGKIHSEYYMTISMLKKELITQFKIKYPFQYKKYKTKGKSGCNESKHGLIHGLVHRTKKENLENFLRDGWLEPFYNPHDWWKQGIYMKLMTGNNIEVRKDTINLVFSVALLDDLDYYGNEAEDFGIRSNDSFYKGICPGCSPDMQKYSSAERAVIYGMENGEIIFREPISVNRYLEKIVVPNGMEIDIPKKYKHLIVNEIDPNTYYRKNCNGEMTKISPLPKFDRSEISDDLIPEEDLIEIVKRNKIHLIEGDRIMLKEIPYTNLKLK